MAEVAGPFELEDLVSYGMQGALEAAERFDETRGFAFSTYAYHRIRGAIYDGLRQMAHLPRSEYARVKIARGANDYLENLHMRQLSGAAPASSREVEIKDSLRAMLGAMTGLASSYMMSMDELVAEGTDFIADQLEPEEQLQLRQSREQLRAAVSRLPDKERHFVEAYYYQDRTLVDAGEELGLSRSWSSRVHARAIDMLREQISTGPD